jgi:type II secretory pathway pseudopilin PulG
MRWGASLPFRRQAGFSLVEAMLAAAIVVTLFLAWGSAMIVATDGENKAGTHSQAIATANQILEYMRRDPAFWSVAEFSGPPCSHCWPKYNDTFGVTPPQACSTVIPTAPAACTFNWLATADPNSSALAPLAVEVYFQGANHQTERYIVMGMARQT